MTPAMMSSEDLAAARRFVERHPELKESSVAPTVASRQAVAAALSSLDDDQALGVISSVAMLRAVASGSNRQRWATVAAAVSHPEPTRSVFVAVGNLDEPERGTLATLLVTLTDPHFDAMRQQFLAGEIALVIEEGDPQWVSTEQFAATIRGRLLQEGGCA